MTRMRFTFLQEALHFADDDKAAPPPSPAFDKLFKSRPVIDALNVAWGEAIELGWASSIDEMMVAFKGRSHLRQYIVV